MNRLNFIFLLSCLMLSLLLGCSRSHDRAVITSNTNSDSELRDAEEIREHAKALEKLKQQLAEAKSEIDVVNSELEISRQKQVSMLARLATAEAQLQAAQINLATAREALAPESQSRAADSDTAKSLTTPVPTDLEPANSKSFQTRFFSWNVESDGSDPAFIASQLAERSDYDLVALTEVLPTAFEMYRNALGSSFASVESDTGNSDRMQVLFNQDRFELLRKLELHEINYQNRYRSPLVVHLKDRKSGVEFLAMVNHLARGKAEIRNQQATQLVEWARDQTLPVIAVGDYNLDYVFAEENGNEAFRLILKDNIWKWIQPTEWIDTNWYDNPENPDGEDDYPGSMLDFSFVAGAAKTWEMECNIIVTPGDFPDDEKSSDHRPFELLFNFP